MMDSTDDGFYSFAQDLSVDEDALKESLRIKERELMTISDHLGLSPSSLGKATRERLDYFSRYLLEKGITDISRAGIRECLAQQLIKQDDFKLMFINLDHQLINSAQLLGTTREMSSLHKKAIKCMQKEREENKENLKSIHPEVLRLENDMSIRIEVDGRTELVKKLVAAVKTLSDRKRKQQEIEENSFPVGENVMAELEEKTKELEALNGRLAALGLQ